jgi:hypothetical protein
MKKIPPANPVDWNRFGVFIFDQREADPGYYVMNYLREAGYKQAQLKRFAVAWCAFYNLGIAARASELQGRTFYSLLRDLYPTATRASERRHFRGQAGLKALTQWEETFPKPEGLADYIMNAEMGHIRERCGHVAQMGDYFKWKWGDITEVLTQEPVNFRGFENKSPKVPQQGAALIAEAEGQGDWDTQATYRYITRAMRGQDVQSAYAPWRVFDVQDAETICCVYKQYRSGGYVPGLRTAKAWRRLTADGAGCRTAREGVALLLEHQPQPLFQKTKVLESILTGGKVYRVEDLLDS